MRLLKNFKYLKGNSLVESVIAIAIISICILVALSIYLNVISQNRSLQYYEAKHKVEIIYNQSITANNFESQDYVFKNYEIQKNATISEKEQVVNISFKIKITSGKTYTINKVIALNKDRND